MSLVACCPTPGSGRAYLGSPVLCNVLQCTHSTGCNARFSVESYNQIIIFPFPDNIFLPFLSQLCKLGRREGRARNSDIVMTLIAAHSIWNNYRLASEMTEIQSHWVWVWTVTGREWSHFNKIITVLLGNSRDIMFVTGAEEKLSEPPSC